MAIADSALSSSGQSNIPPSADLLVIGSGIMGLWAAIKAARAGLSVTLLEEARVASGASGGLLGALMPHMPDRWSDKKQFQFDALLSLEDEVRLLEDETGLSCGYRRSGRLIPLPKPHLRPIAERHSKDAQTAWATSDRAFAWNVLETSPQPDWLTPDIGASGVVHDTFAARVSPRGLTGALRAFLIRQPNARLIEGEGVAALRTDHVRLTNGERIAFGHAIVAAGHRSFDLLGQIGPPLPKPLGSAVKGQAALLKADLDPSLPVIFLNGLYIVAHEGGHVAIGSTSEDVFEDPFATDHRLDDLIVRARELSPVLADATVVERWAGLRPKAIDRDPMVGPHPDAPRVIALTGGFKVSFGLAHSLAECALGLMTDGPRTVPDSFRLDHHLQVALRQQ
ncbi:NAD(P)/FAD-dependent oxidoreductase [Rhizobium oryzicola]|uniref:FAD-binding oxidoreductase n=1 Tax=Rhizobium oryzicola TaxID=1232668 RepID=A0ABT8SUV9_9HYPH|nr:FAD-binding oxidoreductase [Rhizobium oryzicola]MDO1582227.1 FAD-binding oxidoreductase [Rhizobium oryzicola]